MITLILQANVERILYFTDDPAYLPPATDYTYVAYYDGILPDSMTLKNCWSWRFQQGQLVFANDVRPEERSLSHEQITLQRNKTVLRTHVKKKIDDLAIAYLPSCKISEVLRAKKYAAALDFNATGKISSFFQQQADAQQVTVADLSTMIMMAHEIETSRLEQLETDRIKIQRLITLAKTDQELEELRRQIVSLK
jgi:hypothetical protein